MLLRAPSALSIASSRSENLAPVFPFSSASILKLSSARNGGGLVVSASNGANTRPLTGVVFQPFEEVKKELSLIPTSPQFSLARQKYSDACEAAINEQIKSVFFFFFPDSLICAMCLRWICLYVCEVVLRYFGPSVLRQDFSVLGDGVLVLWWIIFFFI